MYKLRVKYEEIEVIGNRKFKNVSYKIREFDSEEKVKTYIDYLKLRAEEVRRDNEGTDFVALYYIKRTEDRNYRIVGGM